MDATDRSAAGGEPRWVRLRALAATVLGWVVHDLVVVASGEEPYLALDLLPASLVAVAIAAVAGALWSRWRRLHWPVLVATALVAALPWVVEPAIRVSWFAFVEALFWLTLCSVVAVWTARRLRVTAERLGFGLGVLAAFNVTAAREGLIVPSLVLLAAALLTAAAGFLSTPRPRRALTVVALLLSALTSAWVARDNLRLRRPDTQLRVEVGGVERPNLVLITLDTVRAHHLAPYGHHRVTTPRLDAWVKRHAVTFTDARSVSSWTLPSHASMFTGLYPAQHGADHPRIPDSQTVPVGPWPAEPLRDDVPALAERLAAQGYRTAAIVSNDVYLAHEFAVDRGFEHYDDRRATRWRGRFLTLVQLAGWRLDLGQRAYRDATTVTDLALRRLERDSADAPFFLFVNYMDAHWPYLPPRPWNRAFNARQPVDPLVSDARLEPLLYDRELAYLDHELDRFLNGLAERELLDGTVVIVTSDHGEAFGEHGVWRHDSTLYEEVIRVPLYVKRAGSAEAGTLDTRRVTSTDIYGIALRELGFEQGALAAVMDAHGEPVIAEWYRSPELTRKKARADVDVDRDLVAWLDGPLKFIVDSRGQVEVYDLERDPGEQLDLNRDPEREERALLRARDWWSSHPPRGVTEREAIDPELLERLRTLGYVD